MISFESLQKSIVEWDTQFKRERLGDNLPELRHAMATQIYAQKGGYIPEEYLFEERVVLKLSKAWYLVRKIDTHFANIKNT